MGKGPEKRRKKRQGLLESGAGGAPAAAIKGKKKKKAIKSKKGGDAIPAPQVAREVKVQKKKKGKFGKKKDKQNAGDGDEGGKSMKAKTIAHNLQGKLHDLTDAPLVGVVNEVQPGQRTGATNENIWQEASATGSSNFAGGFCSFLAEKQASAKLKPACPCVEGLRNRCTWKSRKQLQVLLKQPPPLVSWERWQATSKLQEYLGALRQGRKENQPTLDPLLPENPTFVEKGLVKDLERCAGKHDVSGIAKGMATHSAAMAKDVRQREARCDKEGGVKSCKEGEVVVLNHKHTYDVYLKIDKKRLLKLNTQHYKKVRKMYGEDKNERQFHIDLYLMMSRYNALSAHGMQAALPEKVFGYLHDALGCEFECFASPLNARYAKFCSAFYDTDTCFGSIGDFFTATAMKPGPSPNEGALRQWMMKSGGSFEMNPPFIESMMRTMAGRVEEILEQSTRESQGKVPLSFAIFLPGWKESEAFQKLQKSKFLRKSIAIAAKEHGYVSGAQHQRKDRYTDSPFDTVVMVLQNAAGKSKWSIPEEFEEEVRKAFASGIPTEAMRERRLKEGRGFSDMDGGGGVYKGKKKRDLEEIDPEKANKAKEKAKEKKREKRKEKNKDSFKNRWKKKRKGGGEKDRGGGLPDSVGGVHKSLLAGKRKGDGGGKKPKDKKQRR